MENMRDLLRATLRQSLRGLSPADRIAAAWPIACGRVLAGHGTVAGFADGVLEIEIADDSWLAPFTHSRSILQHDVARIAGVSVTAIHFHLKHKPHKPGAKAP